MQNRNSFEAHIYVVVISEEGSFIRAAKRLGIARRLQAGPLRPIGAIPCGEVLRHLRHLVTVRGVDVDLRCALVAGRSRRGLRSGRLRQARRASRNRSINSTSARGNIG